eukprot:CAMPEP_0196651526 /NCGR_PEP_ID=MMETSP1086-20130531/524_1 /TAXON_ID=77921 /ORGANISM="Cyanoptyche  gloeocystis , Strain SAG4.97" /LENGTH=188 /DNA_ID=CAMNT_0041981579 /DNA_START=122 /DNA_END=688 /DNA_ORIENTATION=+
MAFQGSSIVKVSGINVSLPCAPRNCCDVAKITKQTPSALDWSSSTLSGSGKLQRHASIRRNVFGVKERVFVAATLDQQFKEDWYDQGIFDNSRWPNNLMTDAFYGFGKNAELFNGRAAMMGLAFGLATEALTGKGIFEQLGITNATDEYSLLRVLVGTWVATIVGYVVYAGNRGKIDAALRLDEEDLE